MHYLKFIDIVGFIFDHYPFLTLTSISGFEPIAEYSAKILILGSMPSEASLQQQQYYAHNRNAFWDIMLSILQPDHSVIDYEKRKQILIKYQIAVWDVLQSCSRTGSLDSAIKMGSIKINNFNQFFSVHYHIKKVLFNGAKAENIYIKKVLPGLNNQFNYLEYARLPSTSPAHASLNKQQKTVIWEKEIKR